MTQFCPRIKFSAVIAFLWLAGCSPEPSPVNSPGAGDTWVFTKVSGDNQSTAELDSLDERLVVQLKKLNGTAIDNENIRFYLISGDGQVQKPVIAGGYFELVTITNFEGKASAQFLNHGGDSLTGISQVKAEVFDSTYLSVVFTIDTN